MLMEVTGQEFDMDPKSFTLGSMFSMHLENFTEQIGKICNGAVKELIIEMEIIKVAGVWKEQKFDLYKYMKGTTDRGFALKGGAVEEIKLLLEDQGLNLQVGGGGGSRAHGAPRCNSSRCSNTTPGACPATQLTRKT